MTIDLDRCVNADGVEPIVDVGALRDIGLPGPGCGSPLDQMSPDVHRTFVAVESTPAAVSSGGGWMWRTSDGTVVRVGDLGVRWTLDMAEMIAGLASVDSPARAAPDLSTPDAVADVLFTSGTGAVPKGVAYTHANATFEARHSGGAIPWVVDGGVCVHAHPPFGAAGQARVVAPLLAGIPVFACERFEPREFLETIGVLRAPHVAIVPAMAMTSATWRGAPSVDLSCVRMVSFGAAAMSQATMLALAEFFRVPPSSISTAQPRRLRRGFAEHGAVIARLRPVFGITPPRCGSWIPSRVRRSSSVRWVRCGSACPHSTNASTSMTTTRPGQCSSTTGGPGWAITVGSAMTARSSFSTD